MAEVCVSRNMDIDGGVLGIQPWTTPRHVLDQTFTSTGDGTVTQLTTLPGTLLIDSGILTWTNDSPLIAHVLLRVQRGYRNWRVSNPNAIQIRDRWTWRIGGIDPTVPDPSSTYNGQSGAALDVGADVNATPVKGQYWEWEDGTMAEDWLTPVPPGEDLKVWYRCYVWTPPPWSNNANANDPQHSASVHNTRIQMIAFPSLDTEVTG